MRFASLQLGLLALSHFGCASPATQGLYDLVKRRIPSQRHAFVFELYNSTSPGNSTLGDVPNDHYTISSANASITIQGSSLSALATGLRRYFTDVAHVDLYWFIGNRLDQAADPLPLVNGTITGSSVVPWRYFFNTVTFSYTTPFWNWTDWELELDWLALHGVNLPLAWVGYEKILLDVFREVNLTDDEIFSFFSGPAFQSWNRFGNIQGSWEGKLPMEWIDSQFGLQKQIIARMLELGMTPILPAFTGFVPRALPYIYPNASIINGSQWEGFPSEYTNTTFLEPQDPLFDDLQNRVVSKQIEYYGNITSFYTLDIFNENDPSSGSEEYLRNTTKEIWASLKSANPSAVWVMQGWLFYSNSDFWTNSRIEAFLSGVETDSDMLILDLFSESQPQWQRTNSYYGKPWVWCELHDYGGNQGLYGQISNVTENPIAALHNSSSLVGFGITPEGQEGNEIMYSLLLDQAWSATPLNTTLYFSSWTRNRYAGHENKDDIPAPLYQAWEILRTSAYNNTHLLANAVPKSILELAPNTTGLVNRTGHHPTQLNYSPSSVISAFEAFYAATQDQPRLYANPAFTHDLVDITRQVLANSFLAQYETMLATWNSTSSSSGGANTSLLQTQTTGMLSTLETLDTLLSSLPQFSLSTWLNSAASSVPQPTNSTNSTSPLADTTNTTYYRTSALNQITHWGPGAVGEIPDYASKQWGGLVAQYYLPRWRVFLEYLVAHGPAEYDAGEVKGLIVDAENVGLQGILDEMETDGIEEKDEGLEDVVGRVMTFLAGV